MRGCWWRVHCSARPRRVLADANSQLQPAPLLCSALAAPVPRAPPLPQVFNIPHFVRLVFCAPLEKIGEALDRTADFCRRHHVDAAAGGVGSDGAGAVAVTPAAKARACANDDGGGSDGGAAPRAATAAASGAADFTSPIKTPYR